ncbi:hypothetical protein [Streptomyces sp. NPDC126514]|uniref:hypothetical protein n=1 Tax=Streptomyces sp. NPDC126514 TaxID=3155210 RepID=UPI003318A468
MSWNVCWNGSATGSGPDVVETSPSEHRRNLASDLHGGLAGLGLVPARGLVSSGAAPE